MKVKQIILAFMSLSIVGLFAQGSIEGIIRDDDGKIIPLATVALFQDSNLVSGVSADLEGFYFFDNIKEGKYEAVVSNVDSKAKFILVVKDREALIFNPEVKLGIAIEDAVIKVIKETDFFIVSEPTVDIRKADFVAETKVKNVLDAVKLMTPTTEDKDGNISFRGSRPGQGAFYVDGMRVNGTLDIPTSAIYSLKVYNGGVPSKYGNTASAVVIIETNSYFDFFD